MCDKFDRIMMGISLISTGILVAIISYVLYNIF